jgi:transcriptional regulator with XRE-family HTH domain
LDVLKHFGERVREKILRKGYASVELFAHENHIPKSTLSEILNGKNDPKLTTMAKICSGLEITQSDLFQDPSLNTWVQESAPAYISRKPSQGRKPRKKSAAPGN